MLLSQQISFATYEQEITDRSQDYSHIQSEKVKPGRKQTLCELLNLTWSQNECSYYSFLLIINEYYMNELWLKVNTILLDLDVKW